MKLVLRLVETEIDGSSRSVDVLEIVGRSDPGDIAALGVTLSQGRQLLALIQREVVTAQCRELATRRPIMRGRVSAQGLPPAPDRHPVRPGHRPSAPLPLCRLRHDGSRCRLASTLPIDA